MHKNMKHHGLYETIENVEYFKVLSVFKEVLFIHNIYFN